MRRVLTLSLLVAALTVSAQNRDGVLEENRVERESSGCLADPRCVRALRQEEAQQARDATAFDALPLADKFERTVLGVAVIAGLIWIIARLFGKK